MVSTSSEIVSPSPLPFTDSVNQNGRAGSWTLSDGTIPFSKGRLVFPSLPILLPSAATFFSPSEPSLIADDPIPEDMLPRLASYDAVDSPN